MLARWVVDLQDYSFDVQKRPQNENGNADALSCLPHVSNCATTMYPGYNLMQAQRDNLDIQTVVQKKYHDQPRPSFFACPKNHTFRVLWHC